MKKLRNLIAVMAMMSMAAVLTGCGDDDDDDDDDGPLVPQIVAPADQAALTAPNNVYTVNVAGEEQIVLTFPAAGNYQMVQGEVTETGTIADATRTDNTWTLNVTPDAGQDGTSPGSLRLDFTSNNAGTWTFTPEGGQAESGSFALSTGNGGGDDGGNNGGDNGDGGEPGADLTGQTLQFTYTEGGDKFVFTGPTTHQWENNTATGTYSYDPATRQFTAEIPSRGETFTAVLNEGGSTTVNITTTAGNQEFPATWSLTGP